MFCRGPNHFVHECSEVAEYIRVGKCKKNMEGRIMLSMGTFIPQEILGNNLKDHVDEWHHHNPSQLATSLVMFTINSLPALSVSIAS